MILFSTASNQTLVMWRRIVLVCLSNFLYQIKKTKVATKENSATNEYIPKSNVDMESRDISDSSVLSAASDRSTFSNTSEFGFESILLRIVSFVVYWRQTESANLGFAVSSVFGVDPFFGDQLRVGLSRVFEAAFHWFQFPNVALPDESSRHICDSCSEER